MFLIAATILSIHPLPPLQEDFQPAEVGSRGAPVHSTFKDTTPVLARLEAGTPVKVVEMRRPWARIEVPGGLPAWVHHKFINVEGNEGVLPSSRVRARPLPSTGPESFPLGKFREGDRVEVLTTEGEWVLVMAPERLAGWVRESEIRILNQAGAPWQSSWAQAQEARVVSMRAPFVPAAALAKSAPDPVTPAEPAPQLVDSPEVDPAPKAVQPPATGRMVPAAASAVPVLERLEKAEKDLDRLAAGAFDVHRAQLLREEFGALAWATDDTMLKQRTRDDLARLETMQTAHDMEAQLTIKKAHYQEEAKAAEAAAVVRAEEARPEPVIPGPLETYDTVGWVEYRTGVATTQPFVIVRGGLAQMVEVVGQRYDLSDFVGREVAVRGNWRDMGLGKPRLLEIERIRVLPRR